MPEIYVRCQDGEVRHSDPFTDMSVAEAWAEFGHACTRSHEFEDLSRDEVVLIQFGGSDPDEAIRILRGLIRRIETEGMMSSRDLGCWTIRDENGNSIGTLSVEEAG